MKTDKEMAHEYACILLASNHKFDDCNHLAQESWELVDAMQNEADKRKPSGFPDVLKVADSPQLKSEVIEQILHDIDNYFDSSVSNSLRDANNVIQEIYESLSGENKKDHDTVRDMDTIKCWSCNAVVRLDHRSQNDGCCPNCNVEIEL